MQMHLVLILKATGLRADASGDNAIRDRNKSRCFRNRFNRLQGEDANASGTNAIATGTLADASGDNAIATGTRADASGNNAIASGTMQMHQE